MKTILMVLILCLQVLSVRAETDPAKSVASPSTEIAAAVKTDKGEATEIKADNKSTVKAPAETEIPLNLESTKKSVAAESIAGKVVYSVLVLLMLGVGLFYFLKKYSMPKNSKVQNQIRVLSQHHFGPKRSLALVRVAGESILIGITDNNINLVKSLSLLDEDIPEEIPKSFSKTLDDAGGDEIRNTTMQNASTRGHKASQDTTVDEDFAISGIKDIVAKRLKSMRNFN